MNSQNMLAFQNIFFPEEILIPPRRKGRSTSPSRSGWLLLFYFRMRITKALTDRWTQCSRVSFRSNQPRLSRKAQEPPEAAKEDLRKVSHGLLNYRVESFLTGCILGAKQGYFPLFSGRHEKGILRL